jgi:nicotinate-nucleotide--dimethylbenzimidazole phosphoribosyltransferase
MDWLLNDVPLPDAEFAHRAEVKQTELTKPAGSLGALEDLAIRLAAMQHTEQPSIERIWISIFAADHGIAEAGVSAFPQAVTVEMVKNFAAGGAAINVLARYLNANFEVVDVGLVQNSDLACVLVDKSGFGTANFLQQPAMTEAQLHHALNAGKAAVNRAIAKQAQLFIGGEMGIANTTSATAIACALLQQAPQLLTGAGTGLDDAAILHKVQIVQAGLDKHQNALDNPLSVLQTVGGFEIAALVGAYLFAAQHQIPVLVDGFIASVASLVAIKINPAVSAWFIYAHQSQEKGHQLLLEILQVKPLLDLSMRLGEGSGAATAVPLLQMACKLHNQMATFAQAQITTKNVQ